MPTNRRQWEAITTRNNSSNPTRRRQPIHTAALLLLQLVTLNPTRRTVLMRATRTRLTNNSSITHSIRRTISSSINSHRAKLSITPTRSSQQPIPMRQHITLIRIHSLSSSSSTHRRRMRSRHRSP
jgi:hypothetical protein